MTSYPARITYSSNDFDPINGAIENEVLRAEESLKYSRHKRYNSWSRIVFWISISIAILLIAGAFSWWLLFENGVTKTYNTFEAPKYTAENVELERQTITKIDANEGASIDTSYTVFIKVPLESGESVITGKVYLPNQVEKPNHQYCYLETLGGPALIKGRQLAKITDGVLIYETSDQELLSLAKRHCKFELLGKI